MTQRGRSREAGDEPRVGRTLHDALIRLVEIGAALAFGLLVIVVVGLSSHLVSRTPAPWSTPR